MLANIPPNARLCKLFKNGGFRPRTRLVRNYLQVGIAQYQHFFHFLHIHFCYFVTKGVVIRHPTKLCSSVEEHCGAVEKCCPPLQFSECHNSRLLRPDQFVCHTSPANFACDERVHKICKIEKGDKECKENVNPGLAHDLRPRGREGLGDAAEPQGTPDGRKQ